MPLLYRSITDLREKELIGQVLSDPHYSRTIFNIKGLPSGGRILPGVTLPKSKKRNRSTGDVDILVVPRDEPEQATAIQVKRFWFKVGPSGVRPAGWDAHGKRMSRLFDEGVRQANRGAA
jgi:hypothetical protein